MKKLGIVLLSGSAAFLVAATSGAQPAPATVYYQESPYSKVVRHIATDGQTNVVVVSDKGSSTIQITDTAGLTAGENCKSVNKTTVTCPRPGSVVLDLKDGDDVVTNSSTVSIFAYGGLGNDVLNGGAPLDGLFGDEGRDTINGNGGDDQLNGGDGNDVINGGAGNDNINDRDGDDVISGGAGNDYIQDDSGLDTISGDAGDDTIYSLDSISDTISCGTGTDSYAINAKDILSSCEKKLN